MDVVVTINFIRMSCDIKAWNMRFSSSRYYLLQLTLPLNLDKWFKQCSFQRFYKCILNLIMGPLTILDSVFIWVLQLAAEIMSTFHTKPHTKLASKLELDSKTCSKNPNKVVFSFITRWIVEIRWWNLESKCMSPGGLMACFYEKN